MNRPPPAANGVVSWVVLAAVLNVTDWVLSALGALNFRGYVAGLVLVGLWIGQRVWRGGWLPYRLPRSLWCHQRRLRWRMRQPLPSAFLLLAGLAVLGGLIHLPSNYDGLAYRIPRVLHWLAEGQWHWIHTYLPRENTRPCGMEWLSAPILLFSGSDRWLFLINVIGFLLLPGLCYSVLTRLGVARRVAWNWMWLLPSGYCFVLQAGSIGNDTLAAAFALAAVDFALRARQSLRVEDVWLSGLAAGLMTGVKASNLPLLLPVALAVLPALPLLRRKLTATVGVIAIGALASLAPSATLNLWHCDDWSGAALEGRMYATFNPLVKLPGNSLILLVQNFVPPVFPFATWWNSHAAQWLPESFAMALRRNFESGGARFQVGELATEETAGLGLGLLCLIVVSVLAGQREDRRCRKRDWFASLVRWSPYVSLLVLLATSGLFTVARIIAPYYLLLVVPLLTGAGQTALVRRRWWKRAGLATMILAAVVVVLTPARPLWPARGVIGWMRDKGVESKGLERAGTVYQVYSERWDTLAPIRELLPPDARVVGFISFGDTVETSLWRPFGRRRIVHILSTETAVEARRRGLQYVVIGADGSGLPGEKPLAVWVTNWLGSAGSIIGEAAITSKVRKGPVHWYVACLN